MPINTLFPSKYLSLLFLLPFEMFRSFPLRLVKILTLFGSLFPLQIVAFMPIFSAKFATFLAIFCLEKIVTTLWKKEGSQSEGVSCSLKYTKKAKKSFSQKNKKVESHQQKWGNLALRKQVHSKTSVLKSCYILYICIKKFQSRTQACLIFALRFVWIRYRLCSD